MRKFGFLVILSLALTGCSTVSVHDPLVANKHDLLTLDYCVKSTAKMNILDKTLTKEKNQNRFEEENKVALETIGNYLQANIIKSPRLAIKKLSSCKELAALPRNPTSLYLTLTLSGYGSLNERWKKLFIGSGIIEGTVQGVVVGTATQNPWLGIAIATEEFGQEYLTWSGIDWLMGETYAPVTLEGELVLPGNGSDQQTIWKDSSFVTENDNELKNMTKAEKKKKEVQLTASLHKAEKEVMSSLNDYLGKEVLEPIRNPE